MSEREIKSVRVRRISNPLRIFFILILFPSIPPILLCLIIGSKCNKDICHITSLKSLMKIQVSYRTCFNNTLLDNCWVSEQQMKAFWVQLSPNFCIHCMTFSSGFYCQSCSVTRCQEPYLNQTTRQSLISLVPRPVILPTKKIRLVKQDSFLINLCALLFNSNLIQTQQIAYLF